MKYNENLFFVYPCFHSKSLQHSGSTPMFNFKTIKFSLSSNTFGMSYNFRGNTQKPLQSFKTFKNKLYNSILSRLNRYRRGGGEESITTTQKQ